MYGPYAYIRGMCSFMNVALLDNEYDDLKVRPQVHVHVHTCMYVMYVLCVHAPSKVMQEDSEYAID